MTRILRISGLFQVLIGIEILAIWSLILIQGEVPELETEPWKIVMHILAELFTGSILLISGLNILIRGRKLRIFHLSLGALMYTLIASPGYYAHQKQWAMVAMFAALLLATILILIYQKE